MTNSKYYEISWERGKYDNKDFAQEEKKSTNTEIVGTLVWINMWMFV